MGCGQNKLYDSSIPGYFFLAECTDISESDENEYSSLVATFIAYPFKIKEDYEGNNLWDDFCFETDYLQSRTFEVSGASLIELYNPGIISATPLIITDSGMTISIKDVEYTLDEGENKISNLRLSPGNNSISVSGFGTIEFRFNREVL